MVKKRTTSGKAPISGASRQFGYVGYLHPTWPVANLGMWDTCTQSGQSPIWVCGILAPQIGANSLRNLHVFGRQAPIAPYPSL